MTSKRAKIVLGVTVAAALCWLSAPYWGSANKESLPVSRTPLLFNAEQAFETTQEFVTRNPKRVLGSIEARQAAGYIQDSLERLGYKVDTPSYFDAIIAGRRQAGRNVIAFKSGARPEILAVVAHYDTARTTFQGAMDDGAGVGVLLELARVFAGSPLRHSLVIVASDGEEWGMLGAADIAANYPERKRIAAVLSLDWVGIGDLSALRLDADGQRSGYAPGWLRRIAFRAAEAQGLPVVASSGFQEDVQRAIALSLTDQGPFLNAGIPAINLGSNSVDEARERDVYHSQNDTIANIKPAGIGKYGEAAERILRSIDELTMIPRGMNDDVRWRNDTFVSGWAMAVLQYLAFLPFLVMVGFGWSDCRQSLSGEKIQREAVFFLAWLAPCALVYSLILFCRLMRLLPRNSLYPGPLKDPILENPAWGVVAGILGTAAVVAIGLHFLARYLTRGQSRTFGASKLTLLIFLLILVVLASLYNSYWAATFLTFPALIWGAVGRGRSVAARAGGALAILVAGFVFYAVGLLYARGLSAGWNIVWYATLGLSNGMLPWQGFFLAASAVVLGLRFLALQITSFPE
jgi:hypothetical protein